MQNKPPTIGEYLLKKLQNYDIEHIFGIPGDYVLRFYNLIEQSSIQHIGIKQWNPEEKAQYIAWLIDERGMTYEEVMRKIGSKTTTVRDHYISYQLLLQIESTVPDFLPEYAEGRFSVMYLTLKRRGVQQYLQIDIMAEPETAKRPVPEKHLKNLQNFALWLFGNDKRRPLFDDSRQVSDFNTILSDPKAGLFSFNNFHFMRLTASLGFEARYLVASAIAVYPANRNTDIAVFRIAALTCGITPHRTGEASSPNIVSRI